MTKDQYIERIRDALNTERVLQMPKKDYAEALEEIAADIEGMLDAVRGELEEEDDGDGDGDEDDEDEDDED